MSVIAMTNDDAAKPAMWLRCINCRWGTVINSSQQSPPPRGHLTTPAGMPPADHAAWEEVRSCLAVGAYTAVLMMCRKILFHVAVAFNLSPTDSKGRAPSFAQAVDHLETEGVITKLMRPWADRIKDMGNEANHELGAYGSSDATDIAEFTHQLLRLAYEIPALMQSPSAPVTP